MSQKAKVIIPKIYSSVCEDYCLRLWLMGIAPSLCCVIASALGGASIFVILYTEETDQNVWVCSRLPWFLLWLRLGLHGSKSCQHYHNQWLFRCCNSTMVAPLSPRLIALNWGHLYPSLGSTCGSIPGYWPVRASVSKVKFGVNKMLVLWADQPSMGRGGHVVFYGNVPSFIECSSMAACSKHLRNCITERETAH